MNVPPVGRIWVVLGGFRLSPEDQLPAGAVPRLVPKMVLTASVSGDGGRILAPPDLAGGVAMEGELALVIGRAVHRPATAEEAASAVLGYTCFNDATAVQLMAEREWALSKSLDTFASIGPSVVEDLDEKVIMGGLAITTRVNGEERQRGDTALYKFPPTEVVRYLASHVTLLPGDVISLGTPPPPAPAVPGDLVEIEVEGVGVLHNEVVAAP
jgi:2-keto-4-pentenoate hydratase/2-oxohepta-3-ene-1,7-dioic acid hydratase in catechol pathway